MSETDPLSDEAPATHVDLMRFVQVMLELRSVPYSDVNIADDGIMEVLFSRTFPVENRVQVQGTIYEILTLARALGPIGLRCKFA